RHRRVGDDLVHLGLRDVVVGRRAHRRLPDRVDVRARLEHHHVVVHGRGGGGVLESDAAGLAGVDGELLLLVLHLLADRVHRDLVGGPVGGGGGCVGRVGLGGVGGLGRRGGGFGGRARLVATADGGEAEDGKDEGEEGEASGAHGVGGDGARGDG